MHVRCLLYRLSSLPLDPPTLTFLLYAIACMLVLNIYLCVYRVTTSVHDISLSPYMYPLWTHYSQQYVSLLLITIIIDLLVIIIYMYYAAWRQKSVKPNFLLVRVHVYNALEMLCCYRCAIIDVYVCFHCVFKRVYFSTCSFPPILTTECKFKCADIYINALTALPLSLFPCVSGAGVVNWLNRRWAGHCTI